MIADIEAGLVKRVIIKDMSRLGRDYLQVGMYTAVSYTHLLSSRQTGNQIRNFLALS